MKKNHVFITAEIGINHNGDIELAKKLYGWSPKVDLVDGLISTIEYFKNTI